MDKNISVKLLQQPSNNEYRNVDGELQPIQFSMLPEKSQTFIPNKKRKIGERPTAGIKSTMRNSKNDFIIGDEYCYIPIEGEETKSRSK